jgi:hypothetical protein
MREATKGKNGDCRRSLFGKLACAIHEKVPMGFTDRLFQGGGFER